MSNTEKIQAIFDNLLNSMEIAKEIENEDIFNVLSETGSKISEILDKC